MVANRFSLSTAMHFMTRSDIPCGSEGFSSMGGRVALPMTGAYHAAKFGLEPVLSPDGSARTLRQALRAAMDGQDGSGIAQAA